MEAVIHRMRAVLERMRAAGDPRRYFLAVYLRVTLAIRDEIVAGGFRDPDWVAWWDAVFADLYLDAVERRDRGEPVPAPWSVAFGLTQCPPVVHVLAGVNAHVNYDMPQALLQVVATSEFDDPERIRLRHADHAHVDAILARQVPEESAHALREGGATRTDRVMRPLNEFATRRFLREARAKVWANTVTLDAARRTGDLTGPLAELERLTAERVRTLTAPGPVLLRLWLGGFGVVLPSR